MLTDMVELLTNLKQLLNEAEYHLKNYGDRGECYWEFKKMKVTNICQFIKLAYLSLHNL